MIGLKVRKSAVVTGVTCLALLSLVLYPVRVKAQESRWSSPIQLSQLGVPAWFPDVVADTAGNVHVAWSSGDDEFDTVMYTSLSDARMSSWKNVNDIVAHYTNIAATRPTLAVSEDSRIHLGYHIVDVYHSSADISSASIARNWGEPEAMTSGYAYFPKLAFSADNELLYFYTAPTGDMSCVGCLHLYLSHFDKDGSRWSEPQDISILPIGVAKVQVVAGLDSYLHVVFEAGGDGDRGYVTDPASVMYMSSFDGGVTWSTPIRLDDRGIFLERDGETSQGRNITIGATGNGQLVTAWWNMPSNTVLYRISDDEGVTWSNERPIPNLWGVGTDSLTRQDDYSMSTDSLGRIHLVAVGKIFPDSQELAVTHTIWDGSSWSMPDVIAKYSNGLPEWPRIAIGLGNRLHVVWHYRPPARDPLLEYDAQGYRIMYATNTTDAPDSKPVVKAAMSESTDSSTPSEAQSKATETSGNTGNLSDSRLRSVVVNGLDRNQPKVTFPQDIQSENDDLLLLVVTVMPVVLVIAGIAFYRKRKR